MYDRDTVTQIMTQTYPETVVACELCAERLIFSEIQENPHQNAGGQISKLGQSQILILLPSYSPRYLNWVCQVLNSQNDISASTEQFAEACYKILGQKSPLFCAKPQGREVLTLW